ncbi:alpha/beta hydrolase [Lentzea sp. NPDC034063]|uniref:alpha/beta hydrolase n=1 Tax=unclassified Lentzea TaxID=2643253 RepID=UPI0033F0228C
MSESASIEFEAGTVEVPAEGGQTLSGTLYRPSCPGPHPAITLSPGYGGVKEHAVLNFAAVFARAGFVTLTHDHRGFGASEGEPRHDIDPWRQIEDWRRVISYLEARPEVDPARIGIWGTSYSGGHAIVLGATDRRLRTVVAQVPTISGYAAALRRVPPQNIAALEAVLEEDERAQFRGEGPGYQALVSADPAVPATFRDPAAIAMYEQLMPDGVVWENKVTVRSSRNSKMYEPGSWITRVSPTPLLMIVSTHDTIALTDAELAAYERALEPKRLALLPGGHFDPYAGQFERASRAALDWFEQHLSNHNRSTSE